MVQNPNPNQELRNANTLSLALDNYKAMLNVGSLGKEGTPFLLYFLLFHSWAMLVGLGYWRRIEEVEYPIETIHATMSMETPQWVWFLCIFIS